VLVPGLGGRPRHSTVPSAPARPRDDDTLAEIDEHPAAHVLGDKAVEIADRAIVVVDQLAQILGVEPRRQRGRADRRT
jgi:hypothetical protein